MSEIPFPEANPVETCVCWCLPQFDRQRTTIVRNTSNATKLRTLELGRWALECSSLAQPLSVTHDVARGTPTSYFEHKSQNTHQRTLHRSKKQVHTRDKKIKLAARVLTSWAQNHRHPPMTALKCTMFLENPHLKNTAHLPVTPVTFFSRIRSETV